MADFGTDAVEQEIRSGIREQVAAAQSFGLAFDASMVGRVLAVVLDEFCVVTKVKPLDALDALDDVFDAQYAAKHKSAAKKKQ